MSDLPRDLRVKAGMIMMCERIPFGSDAALMELAANEVEHLQQRNAELAAQLEQLRLATLNAISFMTGGEAKAQLRDVYDATPAQCLAEHDREVAASAVEPAIRSALRTFGNADLSEDEIKKLAFEYSRKVLRGEI